jgi:hypothetical protein
MKRRNKKNKPSKEYKMKNKERIDEILESVNNIQRAEPSPFLYTRILGQIAQKERSFAPPRLVWIAAASFLVLVFLNAGIVKRSEITSPKSDTEQLAEHYQLLNTTYFYYN